jgi:hypothetical protein
VLLHQGSVGCVAIQFALDGDNAAGQFFLLLLE